MRGRVRPVEYRNWARAVPSSARWDLTASGVPDTCGAASLAARESGAPDPLATALGGELGLELAALSRRDQAPAVIERFTALVAARYGVDPDCVVPTLGASQAITHVMFALSRPGDHVIVERPSFEPLHRGPETLGLSVSRLERRVEEGWRPVPDRLARLLTPKTRAVILSSLHNPSGVAIETADLEAIAEMAARVGAQVLVDEVYLDFDFDPSGERPWRPAAVAIDNGLSWSSLTKCLGFSALRVGWLVTRDPDTARALRTASDYFHVQPPLAPLAVACAALEQSERLTALARTHAAKGRAVVDAWLEGETRVGWVPPSAGQTGLLRLPALMQDLRFAEHLRERYDTQVVPGGLFEAPGFVRLSFNLPPAELEQALAHLSAALDDRAP